jgi:arsenite transporter
MTPESGDDQSAPSAAGTGMPVTAALSPAMPSTDAEKQVVREESPEKRVSAFKSLGWLDRFLAVWILLAMVLGVLLGNFVPETGPALQKGKFAEVSVPIGNVP